MLKFVVVFAENEKNVYDRHYTSKKVWIMHVMQIITLECRCLGSVEQRHNFVLNLD